jgi:hypothetical protein
MSEEIVEALLRSRAWLARVGTRDEAAAKHALQALLGIWVCDVALGESSRELQTMTARTRTLLEEDAFDGYEHDAKLLLVCLQMFGRDPPNALTTFAEEIADALAGLPRIPPKHAGVAAVLAELGFLGAPAIDVDEPDIDTLLRGGPDSVRAACSAVAAATHFGARHSHKRFDALQRTLPALFLQTLRSYDLDTAAMLLRTSRYLRMPPTGRIEEGIAFLVDQQKPDGRFGYFAVEASSLRRSQEIADFDDVLTLALPITSTCTWALAELVIDGPVLFQRRPVKEEPWSTVS